MELEQLQHDYGTLVQTIAKQQEQIDKLKNIINIVVLPNRYVFERPIGGGAKGLKLGLAITDLLSFYGVTPIAQPSSTGITGGVTVGGGTPLTHVATFTGGSPYVTAYTISDMVAHLKQLGLLAV